MMARYSAFASRRSWHSVCEPWHVEQMFIIIGSPVCWASAKVRALSVSASSWLCSAITPAPQHDARSSSTRSMPSMGATLAIEPWSSGVKPRLTHPGQYATFMRGPRRGRTDGTGSCVRAPLRGQVAASGAAVRRRHRVAAGDALTGAPRRVLLTHHVQVELDALLAPLDHVEEPLDVRRRLVRMPERLAGRDLAALQRLEDRRQRADQLRHRARVELAAVGVRQEVRLVQQAVAL